MVELVRYWELPYVDLGKSYIELGTLKAHLSFLRKDPFDKCCVSLPNPSIKSGTQSVCYCEMTLGSDVKSLLGGKNHLGCCDARG